MIYDLTLQAYCVWVEIAAYESRETGQKCMGIKDTYLIFLPVSRGARALLLTATCPDVHHML